MAGIYVRSTDGDDLDSGATWALAKATLAAAGGIDVAGDVVYLSQSHAEVSGVANAVISLAGLNDNPVKLLSVSDAAEPPTALAVGASITTTGAYSISISGAGYVYGMSFYVGSGFVNTYLTLNSYTSNPNTVQTYERCQFNIPSTGTMSSITVNGSAGSNTIDCATVWKDCDIKLASNTGTVRVFGRLTWNGGSVLAGHAATSIGLISSANSHGEGSFGLFSGLDLGNMGTSQPVFESTPSTAHFVITNSKLPAGWAANLVGGTINVGDRFEMYNCDNADTNYRLWVEDFAGSIKSETTIVRTDGASDGTTPFAWRMISGANTIYPVTSLDTPCLPARWNDTVGLPITITVEILHDSLTPLKDDEVWLDVQFLGTAGYPLSMFESDAKADILATATDQTASSEAWTTTGLTNPNKQKLSVTVTPQGAGFIQAKVHLAKASYTVFVDPKLTVS